ncbi:MAG TPA: hypothetical protein VMY69_01685 [Phycisphaerae bacterium]|nr:hypothetical protein [Phycisphaerae bacterium]
MPIAARCACGKEYRFKDEYAGRRAKCPACGQVVRIPGTRLPGTPIPHRPSREASPEGEQSRTVVLAALGFAGFVILVGIGLVVYFLFFSGPAPRAPKPAASPPVTQQPSAAASQEPAPASGPPAPAAAPAAVEPSAESPSQSPATTDHRQLVAALVARGEAAGGQDPQEAQWAYFFAARYAPDDAQIRGKAGALGWRFAATEAELAAMGAHVLNLREEFCRDWPDPVPQMEIVELRMLLDEQLVGNLRFSNFTFQEAGETARMFLSKPTLSAAQVREIYGKPSAEKEYPDGDLLLTYGRLRLVVLKGGEVATVLFR